MGELDNFEPLQAATQLNFQPGECFEYSNLAYNALALIIERVSGMKWQDFVKAEIFQKTGMKTSEITDGSHPSRGVAHAYDRKGGSFVENDYGEFPTFCAAGNGGIWSTVRELFAYERAIQSASFLSARSIARSRTIYEPSAWSSNRTPQLGYSWWIGEAGLFPNRPYNTEMIYHTGSQGGFRAFHVWVPEHEILVVGLFNRPLERVSLVREVLDFVAEDGW